MARIAVRLEAPAHIEALRAIGITAPIATQLYIVTRGQLRRVHRCAASDLPAVADGHAGCATNRLLNCTTVMACPATDDRES
jgi:hypothetical protein